MVREDKHESWTTAQSRDRAVGATAEAEQLGVLASSRLRVCVPVAPGAAGRERTHRWTKRVHMFLCSRVVER